MKYKLAIFDLDGTILDTLEDLANSTNHALKQYGLPSRGNDEVKRFVGNGIRKLIERAVPTGTAPDLINKVFDNFKEYYKDNCTIKTRPYDGVPEMLAKLRGAGVKTAVVSNKADFAVQELCENYFPGMFDFTAGEKPGVNRKPSPDTVNTVLKTLGINRTDTVYIGDSDVDILTASNAGTDCISVDWGFRERELLLETGASIIVSKPSEITQLILL